MIKVGVISLVMFATCIILPTFFGSLTFEDEHGAKELKPEMLSFDGDKNSCDRGLPVVLLSHQLLGGIGNQLFAFASSYSFSRKMGLPLYVEVSKIQLLNAHASNFFTHNDRSFILHLLNISWSNDVRLVQRLCPEWRHALEEDKFVNVRHRYMLNLINDGQTPKVKEVLYNIDDYCLSEQCFEDFKVPLKAMFQLKNTPSASSSKFQDSLSLIKSKKISVGVHIRRGDYTELGEHRRWVTPILFYQTAMDWMIQILKKKKNKTPPVSFFVFSDEIGTVKNELIRGLNLSSPHVRIHFVCSNCGQTTNLEQFFLISSCKHAIISYSTFSWWAAYLIRNPQKVIIAPRPHPKMYEGLFDRNAQAIADNEDQMRNFYPEEWFTLDPFFNDTDDDTL